MLTYEYECENCGHSFEIEQSIKDSVKKKCPECKKYKLERLISGGMCGFVRQEPTTVGQLGDANAKRERNSINEARAKREESKPKPEKSFYNAPDKKQRQKINRMSANQKYKYIMEGD